MSTSGTTAFAPDFLTMVEEAYERCGLELRSGYDLETAIRSANLIFIEWATRGVNLWTIDNRTKTLTAGTAVYALDADIIDLIEQKVLIPDSNSSVNAYVNVARVGLDTHAMRVNPTLQGRPTEMYVERLIAGPTINLWPVPDQAGYVLDYWVLRRVEDAGAATNDPDMPFRFIPAFIAELALRIGQKNKNKVSPDMIQDMRQEAGVTWLNATTEDRDRSPTRLVPSPSVLRVF